MLSSFSMHKKNCCRDNKAWKKSSHPELCKKYMDRSVNEVYSKLLCRFSNTNGITGKNGRRGIRGTHGASGDEGNIGDSGDKGYQGNVGLFGGTGNIGNNGNMGLRGDEGDTGNIGNIGNEGLSGNIGLSGNLGSQGSSGEVGDLGNVGSIGLSGDSGKISLGSKGEIGDNGDAGVKGGNSLFRGDKGDIGEIGEAPAGSPGNVGDFGDKGIKENGNGNKGDQGDQGDEGIIGDPISPINVYAFAKNMTDSISVEGSYGPLYYPSNNLSSGITIIQPPPSSQPYTLFINPTSTTGGTYLIIYDVKAETTITHDTIFSIVVNESPVTAPGSQIQAPYGYKSDTFVSFNRVFLAQLDPLGDFGFIVSASDPSELAPISLLGGTNGPQILIIQIA